VHRDPRAHLALLKRQEKKITKIEQAAQSIKGSIVSKLLSTCFTKSSPQKNRRDSVKDSIVKSIESYQEQSKIRIDSNSGDMQWAAFQATRSIYGVVVLAIGPVMGVVLLGLSISWNSLEQGPVVVLQATTVIFELCFLVLALFIWDSSQLSAYTDTVICALAPFADWYVLQEVARGRPQ